MGGEGVLVLYVYGQMYGACVEKQKRGAHARRKEQRNRLVQQHRNSLSFVLSLSHSLGSTLFGSCSFVVFVSLLVVVEKKLKWAYSPAVITRLSPPLSPNNTGTGQGFKGDLFRKRARCWRQRDGGPQRWHPRRASTRCIRQAQEKQQASQQPSSQRVQRSLSGRALSRLLGTWLMSLSS